MGKTPYSDKREDLTCLTINGIQWHGHGTTHAIFSLAMRLLHVSLAM